MKPGDFAITKRQIMIWSTPGPNPVMFPLYDEPCAYPVSRTPVLVLANIHDGKVMLLFRDEVGWTWQHWLQTWVNVP